MLISGFTILVLLLTLLLTIALLWHYPVKGTRWYVYFWVFVSWFMAFGVVALIPFDVWLVPVTQTLSPASDEDRSYLRFCWHVVYWLVFVLCWFVLPIMQEYEIAGEFSMFKKLKRAVRRLLWMYFLMGTAGLMFVIYLGMIGKLVLAHLPYVLIAFSNCWGLFQTIFLLGYGLVAMPRYLWFESNYAHYLKYLSYKACRIDEERSEFELKLHQLVKLAKAADEIIPLASNLRPFIEIVLKQVSSTQCPSQDAILHRESLKELTDREVMEELGDITKKKLVLLNRLLKQAVFDFHRSKA